MPSPVPFEYLFFLSFVLFVGEDEREGGTTSLFKTQMKGKKKHETTTSYIPILVCH